jgi:protein arginine N-methyltransferase 1
MELQMKLLGDRVRNKAFFEALKKTIRPGWTTVADIGSGTGFLSFLASRLGAKTCFLYEQDEALLELSRNLAAANQITNCRFIPLHSTRVKNPEKVDVVISETLGNFALEEHIIENLRDAKRFLKPGGTIIPLSLEQWVAPVTAKSIFDEINPWDRVGFGIDFYRAKIAALNNMYVSKIHKEDLLHEKTIAQKWDEIDFYKNEKSARSGKALWTIDRHVVIYGFAVWWTCTIAPGITLSTSPYSPRTHWDQIFLPLTKPLPVEKKDRVEIRLTSDSRYTVGIQLAWETSLFRRGSMLRKIAMSTDHGVQ